MLRRYGITLAVAVCALIFFVNAFSPSGIPTVFYIVPFMFMFVGVFSFVMLLGVFLSRLQIVSISRSLLKRLSTLVSLYVIFLVLLKSIGQLTTRDVVIGLILITLLYVYFDRMTTEKPMQ